MKKNLAKSSIVMFGVVAGTICPASAFAKVNQNLCQLTINAPSNAHQELRSSDCKVVYVLPSSIGIAKVIGLTPLATQKACDDLGSHFDVESTELEKLTKMMNQTNPPATRESIERQISVMHSLSQDDQDLLTKPGAAIRVAFEMGDLKARAEEYKRLNPEIVKAGVSFQPAMITKRYLSFNAEPAAAVQLSTRPGVLGIQVMGSKPEDAVNQTGQLDATGLNLVALDVELSMGAVCPIMKANLQLQDSSVADLATYAVGNMTYTVKNGSTSATFTEAFVPASSK